MPVDNQIVMAGVDQRINNLLMCAVEQSDLLAAQLQRGEITQRANSNIGKSHLNEFMVTFIIPPDEV
jgi:hypothetical protein